MITLKKEALKKHQHKSFLKINLEYYKKHYMNQPSQGKNKHHVKSKKANQKLKCDIKRLQTAYNKLEQKWKT